MNISVKGEYALQAILDLAVQNRDAPVKIADIATRQKIPQKFLELILAGLKQGGFVESRRGAEGGPAENITIGQVIRYVEGSRAGQRAGKSKDETAFTDLWREVDRAISSVVDQTNFADLARRWREKQGKYVPNWEI
jgi:Rrf2 family cysteine metabolism transcriptional repressor